MAEGLAEKGTTFNCRECKYGSECNTANAHGYKVGFCSFFTQKTKAQTNADRIRSMTDDELAKWLDSLDIICPSKERTYKCGNYDNCCGCLLEWLKEEVKDV